jgi:hypothetical protein
MLACSPRSASLSEPVHSGSNSSSPGITKNSAGLIQVEPSPVDARFKNPWTPELEQQFQQRANQVIRYYAGKNYGNTYGENEKRSYSYAMLDFLAGNRAKALEFLQRQDDQASDNQHTAGIDYYYAFTLKNQIRKYFFFGKWLDPAYKQRMFEGAKQWTAKDPKGRPHPIYDKGNGKKEGWGPDVRGGWADGRNTDNLRAMREVSVYLMAEETGNEAVRQLYKQKIQRYVWALYHIGMGEWDSENYHGHTMAAYINLYDFAQDPEVKLLGKAAMDWFSAAGAVKYFRGGFGGPTKRDYGGANVIYGSNASHLLSLYFGDVPFADPEPDRDAVHLITSAYRPPQAVVALARKQFNQPVELLSTKPVYENWKPGGEDRPGYWDTTFFGHTYQMGSVVSEWDDGDVGPFKLMAENSQRGVDYFVANTGGDRVQPGKHPGDQIGQYRNLLIWLRPASKTPFFFQIPKTAKAEIEGCRKSITHAPDCIWFFRLENTWVALSPINLTAYTPVAIADPKVAEHYSQELTLKATSTGNGYAGFVLEVGEPQTHGSYANFKQGVRRKSRLNLQAIAAGTVQLHSSTGTSLKLTHNAKTELPIVVRNGVQHDWFKHLDLYKSVPESSRETAPISLGWKQGTLRVTAGGSVFEETVSKDGKVSFKNSDR